MITARAMSFFDGDFDYPVETYAVSQGDGWMVIKRGPKYVNTYEVTETDETGLAWLRAHDRSHKEER